MGSMELIGEMERFLHFGAPMRQEDVLGSIALHGKHLQGVGIDSIATASQPIWNRVPTCSVQKARFSTVTPCHEGYFARLWMSAGLGSQYDASRYGDSPNFHGTGRAFAEYSVSGRDVWS